jgi:hypothetical protein
MVSFKAFNFTYRYIDDVLSINYSRFAEFLPLIYHPELAIKKNMWNCSLIQQILNHRFYDWKLCEWFLLSRFLICHAVGWYTELKNQKFWWRIPERKILILGINNNTSGNTTFKATSFDKDQILANHRSFMTFLSFPSCKESEDLPYSRGVIYA